MSAMVEPAYTDEFSRAVQHELLFSVKSMQAMMAYRLWQEEMAKPRNCDPYRLLRRGYKVYSQNDEDGIIQEIFDRVGVESRNFVEVGVGDGTECNTARLLADSWSGLWIEPDQLAVRSIRKDICPTYKRSLTLVDRPATVANVNDLIGRGVSFDFLSIDIDFNDYWVWKAVEARPRVVVIEYNALWRPPLSVVVPYDEKAVWDGTGYQGASLEALVRLGREKGYKLVGCNYTGSNAFFVRDDLVGDKFLEDCSAEAHYEPPRHCFWLMSQHRPRTGPLVRV